MHLTIQCSDKPSGLLHCVVGGTIVCPSGFERLVHLAFVIERPRRNGCESFRGLQAVVEPIYGSPGTDSVSMESG